MKMAPVLKRNATRTRKSKVRCKSVKRLLVKQREERIEEALAAVRRGEMNVNNVSVRFKIPNSTPYKP